MNISEIEFYESINELPYGNYIEFQQLLAIEAEQGSDGGDLKKNLYSAIALINDDAKEEAVQKIVNTINLYGAITKGITPKLIALSFLVKEPDKDKAIEKIKACNYNDVLEKYNALKKKLLEN